MVSNPLLLPHGAFEAIKLTLLPPTGPLALGERSLRWLYGGRNTRKQEEKKRRVLFRAPAPLRTPLEFPLHYFFEVLNYCKSR